MENKYPYLIAAWFLFPSFAMVMFSFSSLATGMMIVSLFVILLKHKFIIKKIFLWIIFSAVFSSAFSYFILGQPASLRQLLSIFGFFIGGVGISQIFDECTVADQARSVVLWIKKFYFLMVIIGFIGIFMPLRLGPYELLASPIFPFSEPSHYALVYAPMACLALLVCNTRMRICVCIVSLALAMLMPSLTILVVTLLLLLLSLSIKSILVLGILVYFSISNVAVVAPDLFNYFFDRLSDDSSENITRLVYIQGWQNMVSAFSFTSGFGIGFQNLGNEPPGTATSILESLHDSALNRTDGGFLMAKIVGEFGIVGLLFVFFLFILSIAAGFFLRRNIQEFKFGENISYFFPLCAIYMLIVELFIRGVGYFSPSLFFAIFCLSGVIKLIYKRMFVYLKH